MFDLEKSITAWRVQMRASNLTPSQLDELEAHLREDIARHLQAGIPEPQAFTAAAAQIGSACDLGAEFRRAHEFMITPRILGLLWFIYCAGSFYHTTSGLMAYVQSADFHFTALFALGVLFNFIYLRGLIASIQLLDGNQNARRFILFIAAFDAVGGVAMLFTRSFQPLSCAFTILGLVTLWLLWPRNKARAATT